MFPKFECNAQFETMVTKARMKVLPNLNLQLMDFDLPEENFGFQIIMPIDTIKHNHSWIDTFHSLGFEILDALIPVPKLPIQLLFPIVSLKTQFDVKNIFMELGSIPDMICF